jgi:hypothetical protein
MRKSDFLSLGGFDPIFDPAYFEDCDLAVRLRSRGLFTYYCGRAVVYHHVGATSGREWTKDQFSGIVSTNHAKFVKRWGDFLKRRISEDCEPDSLPPIGWEPEKAAGASDTVVLYSSIPLAASETSRRLLEVAGALQELFDVTIAADEIFSRCRVYSLCSEFGVELRSFRVRRISDIDQSKCGVIVVFGRAGPGVHISSTHLIFERQGLKLLDHLT